MEPFLAATVSGMNLATSPHSDPAGNVRNVPKEPHKAILQTYFFNPIDRGIGADETPLFTRRLDGKPLSHVIAETFQLPPHEAEAVIDMARQEVAL